MHLQFFHKISSILGSMKKLLWLLLFCPITIWALTFNMPPKGARIVGHIQTTQVKSGDTFTSIGQQYDVGYYELYEANPGVDPDNPLPGTILIIPTQYILPAWLHNCIVINVAEMRLYYESDKLHKVFTFPLGIGKQSWGTPNGYYKIIKKIKHPVWHVPKSIFQYRAENNDPVPNVVPAGADNPLGDYALRLSDPRYLIHGTDDPTGIGRRSSAGCMRLYPEDIKQLFSLVKIGTKIFIINKPYKVTKKDAQIYLEAHMPLYEQRIVFAGDILPAVQEVQHAAQKNANHIDWQQVLQIAKQHLGIPLTINTTTEISNPPQLKITPYNNLPLVLVKAKTPSLLKFCTWQDINLMLLDAPFKPIIFIWIMHSG